MELTKYLLFCLTWSFIRAAPRCKYKSDKKPELICRSSEENYILKRGLVSDNNRTSSVTLRGCRVSGVEYEAFENMPSLKYIDLSQNSISELKLGVLDDIKTVTHLNLSYNALTTFPIGLFDQLPNLSTLDLTSNSLENIELVVFDTLQKLKYLNLADNNISTIKGSVFKTLKRLKSIILRGNKLTSLPVELFQDMKNLANIDLSHNSISTINVNSFHGTSVKNLNLADNKLTYLTSNFCLELRNFAAKLTKFYFNQNPWQCACLRDIVDEVKRLGISYNSRPYDGRHPVCVTTEEFHCNRHDRFNRVYIDMYDDLVVNTKNL
ncbi:unnamed protein product [Danaus chrysippus]|uniref:(African queen) hypothetical protein n=1 Tax=Danaus chrysippus TaxID=151541 RepID=A0A8J2QTF1_9NEOP|nr:unnamed protein product [Danaus chrysippus]